jgi:uncharacterized protein
MNGSAENRIDHALSPFILKVAARCNLNCSYCHIYNKGDATWKARPAVMSDETFDATIARIRRHCLFTGQGSVSLVFHGGEPTLVGARRFDAMCLRARQALSDVATVKMAIQTNATLLDEEWIEALSGHQVDVGISMDGPRDVHDAFRVDHRGQGSYDAVERATHLLRKAGVDFAILSVVQPGADSLRIHRHFLALGCRSISYLLPAYTHDTIEPVRRLFGPTPCADFLIPIFDDWWFNGTLDVRIREFWNAGRLIMGGSSVLDSLGNPPLRFVSVESDGAIEGLDKLRVCEEGMTATGLTVHEADFRDLVRASPFHASVMRGVALPDECERCEEKLTCAGGYLPHRYSRERQFNNPSVWCADLLKLFRHLRTRMGVSVRETMELRQSLRARQRLDQHALPTA